MSEDIDLLAHGHGWEVVFAQDKDFEKERGAEVNWKIREDAVLGYLESYLTDVCCFVVMGSEPEFIDTTAQEVELKLPGKVLTVGELLDNMQRATDPRALARALVESGFGAPVTFDADFFHVFEEACTQHPIHNVRSIAIASIAYVEWPEFLPLLRSVEATDTHESVRARAAHVRRAYEAAQ
ncbi:hypothetical protein [Streptomyces zhihengii]|uniref:hypothetical protein n=1 Tax=Streptomyces zhihengii TaxID=1818004 RepID=UPI0033A477EE